MFGSYNAGPGNILEAQDLVGCSGLATNRWLSIASSLPEIIGRHARETISYVQRIESLYNDLTMESIMEGSNTERLTRGRLAVKEADNLELSIEGDISAVRLSE